MKNSFVKETAYKVLDLVTFGRGIQRTINDRKVRFPVRWSRYFKNNYEHDNYMFLQEQVKPGMHIIDIGAHIGLFSVYTSQLAGHTGKIVCFEPTPGTFSILKNTLRLNHINNVTPRQEAVGSQQGHATFYVSEVHAGCNANSLVEKQKDGTVKFDVAVTTLDNIVKDYDMKPGLVKIDVEGAELDVLKGGSSALMTFKPLIILGLHPDFIRIKGDSLQEIWNVLKSYGYRIFFDGAEISETNFVNEKEIFEVQLIPA